MPKKKENFSSEERLAKTVIPKNEKPYKISNNWVWTRLGDITEINPKKEILNFDEDEEISFIPMKLYQKKQEKLRKWNMKNIQN